jgi:hypothetical protein
MVDSKLMLLHKADLYIFGSVGVRGNVLPWFGVAVYVVRRYYAL